MNTPTPPSTEGATASTCSGLHTHSSPPSSISIPNPDLHLHPSPNPDPSSFAPSDTNTSAPLSKKQRNKLRRKALRQASKAEKARRRVEAAANVTGSHMSQSLVVHGGKKSVPVPLELLHGEKQEWVGADPVHRPSVEKEHVVEVYNAIAPDWHATRYKCWPKVEAFVRKQRHGSLFGDLGCGNGKVVKVCEEVGGVVGCDISCGLLEICASKGFEVACADCVRLPFRSLMFDAVLSIAVLHHISTVERRLKLIEESMRVVKVGGQGLFYAWAYEQKNSMSGHKFKVQDVLVPFHSKKNTKQASKEPDEKAAVLQRYCHVYREGELHDLFRQLPWIAVEELYFDTGNWAVIARKLREHDAV